MLGTLPVEAILKIARIHLASFLGEEGFPQDRKGGYLCIAQKDGQPLLIARVGECSSLKNSRFITLAQEKALRLSNRLKDGHVSSWQSRDESQNRYGGAVLAGDFVLSFSGLPERADEALVLYLAHAAKLETKFAEIVALSDNTFFVV